MSSKAASSHKGKPKPTSRRLNLRALFVLLGLIVVAAPGLIALKMLRDQYGAKAFLAEGKKRLEKGDPALAIGYLNAYLALIPDDLDALELKSKVLFDTAHDTAAASEALKVHGQMISVKPQDPRWEQARRRMVRLNLMVGRYRAALETAKQLKGDDAEAHRLYARASAAVGVAEKDSAAIDKARQEYEAAESKEPGDVESAEDLARIYRDRQEKPEKALQVLDQVVLSTGNDAKKHAAALLARARHYGVVDAVDKAAADVDEAVRDDPEGLMPRVVAAEIALQRGDTSTARRHLAAIAPSSRNDLKVKTIEGLIDLAESRPDEAIQSWREGLMQIGGNDASLTWQLAQILLEAGRVTDANPLIEQYRRLVGGEEPDAKYLYLRAMAMLKANRPSEAAARFEAIRYKVPKWLEPYLLNCLGQCYEATRDLAKATESYRAAAEGSRKFAAPWKALARLQAQLNPDDAQATLQKGLTLSPNNADLLVSRAQFLYAEELKKPADQRSMTDIDRLLELARKAAPASTEIALFQAELYANSQRADEALALLKSASALAPRTPSLWLAQANLLSNQNRLSEAQQVLDQGVSAAGPQAIFYIARASLLVRQAHVGDAKKVLTEGLNRLPKEQKPLLWKTLGELYKNQKDYTSAREAFKQWAELQAENPEPRLALFELALASHDEAAIERTIAEVRKVSGDRSYYWRAARVEDLLRTRKEAPDARRDATRLDEAEKLVKEIEDNDPQLALGYLLDARVKSLRKQNSAAIDALRKALERGAGLVALDSLVVLLGEEKRDKELAEIARQYPALASTIERFTTQQAIRSGDKDRAKALAEKAIAGDPQGLNTQTWAIDVLRSLGEPKEAEAAARKFVDERPTEAAPWLLLLMLQVNNREETAAAETVEQIRQQVKTNRPEVLWGQCYRAIGNFKRAEECFQDAIKRWPQDLGVLSAAVTYYEQVGRRDATEATLRQVREHDPSSVWATRKLALSLAGHPDRTAWREALALVGPEARPNDGPDEQMIRSAVYAQGPEPAHLKKAVSILEGLLEELPTRLDLHDQAARLLLSSGDLEKARTHAARAAEEDGVKPDSILLYASILLRLKDLKAAEEQLGRLVKIDPKGLPVIELRARLLAAQGKGDEAARIIEKAFDERVSNPEALVIGETMVQILSSIQQLDAAERIARRAAEIAPRGRNALVSLLVNRGKLDDAAEQLEKVKAIDPAMAAAAALALAAQPGADPRWIKLAGRYEAEASKSNTAKPTFKSLERLAMQRHFEGNYKEEVETYRKMLDMNPSSFLFLNNMAWTLSEELKAPDEGLKMAETAIEKLGKAPHVLDTRGVIYTRLGKYQEAVNDLEIAADGLKDPSVAYHAARAYTKMGKPEEARKWRERALKAGLVRENLQPSEKADWDEVMNTP